MDLTRILKLGMAGDDVKKLQVALVAAGYNILADGKFGMTTRNAVVAVQIAGRDTTGKSLLPDGVVGQKTWSALFGWDRQHLEKVTGEFQNSLVEVALKYFQLGVTEDLDKNGLGKNTGKYINDWIKFCGLEPPQPWCAAAVCSWLDEARKSEKLNIDLPHTASAADLFEWFSESRVHTGKLISDIIPVKGDIGFIYFSTLGRIGHTFVIVDVPSADTVTTIEGNSNPGGSRDGYQVARRYRPMSQIYGVGRICI